MRSSFHILEPKDYEEELAEALRASETADDQDVDTQPKKVVGKTSLQDSGKRRQALVADSINITPFGVHSTPEVAGLRKDCVKSSTSEQAESFVQKLKDDPTTEHAEKRQESVIDDNKDTVKCDIEVTNSDGYTHPCKLTASVRFRDIGVNLNGYEIPEASLESDEEVDEKEDEHQQVAADLAKLADALEKSFSFDGATPMNCANRENIIHPIESYLHKDFSHPDLSNDKVCVGLADEKLIDIFQRTAEKNPSTFYSKEVAETTYFEADLVQAVGQKEAKESPVTISKLSADMDYHATHSSTVAHKESILDPCLVQTIEPQEAQESSVAIPDKAADTDFLTSYSPMVTNSRDVLLDSALVQAVEPNAAQNSPVAIPYLAPKKYLCTSYPQAPDAGQIDLKEPTVIEGLLELESVVVSTPNNNVKMVSEEMLTDQTDLAAGGELGTSDEERSPVILERKTKDPSTDQDHHPVEESAHHADELPGDNTEMIHHIDSSCSVRPEKAIVEPIVKQGIGTAEGCIQVKTEPFHETHFVPPEVYHQLDGQEVVSIDSSSSSNKEGCSTNQSSLSALLIKQGNKATEELALDAPVEAHNMEFIQHENPPHEDKLAVVFSEPNDISLSAEKDICFTGHSMLPILDQQDIKITEEHPTEVPDETVFIQHEDPDQGDGQKLVKAESNDPCLSCSKEVCSTFHTTPPVSDMDQKATEDQALEEVHETESIQHEEPRQVDVQKVVFAEPDGISSSSDKKVCYIGSSSLPVLGIEQGHGTMERALEALYKTEIIPQEVPHQLKGQEVIIAAEPSEMSLSSNKEVYYTVHRTEQFLDLATIFHGLTMSRYIN